MAPEMMLALALLCGALSLAGFVLHGWYKKNGR